MDWTMLEVSCSKPKNRVFKFNYQKINMSESVRCSKNGVWVCFMSDLVFSSGNRANTKRKSNINQKTVQFSSKKHNWFLWKHSSSLRKEIYTRNFVKSIKKCIMSCRSKKHKIINVNLDDVQFSSFWMCIFNLGEYFE